MRRFATVAAIVVAFAALAAAFFVAGCQAEKPAPLVVTPSAMVRMFRDSPAKAAKLYEGRTVFLAIRGGKFHILKHPPIIVSDPPASRPTNYTTGIVRVVRDGVYTGDRCTFTIVIECAVHSD